MISRCYRENSPGYKNYGGRGIQVCAQWRGRGGFERFLKDMGERPIGTTLDRKRNNLGYILSNCRWSNDFVQANNRRQRRGAGVSKHKTAKARPWFARIYWEGKQVLLGYFRTREEACDAYNAAKAH